MMQDTPDTVLFVVTKKEYTAGVGIPPCNEEDNYLYRANPVGKLMNATKMLFSPGGELFVVRGGDVFRGHMPVTDEQEWFDLAKKVGKVDWGNIKFLCFDPEGDLYAVTNNGDFYKGPAPTNENMPWLYRQATKIGAGNWNSLHALFFDPDGLLYAVRADGKLVRGSPPTCPDDDWLNTAAQVGNDNWLHFTNFIAFSPEGELWCVHNSTGRLFKWPPATMSRLDFPHCDAVPVGQGFSACCFMAFTTDKTIRSIEHFEFLPDLGKIVSVVPEVLASQIYKNNSGEELVHSFTMSREVTESSTFSQDHGFMLAPGAKITFQDPIPFIDEAEISLNSATRTWNFTKTTEAKVGLLARSGLFSPILLMEALDGINGYMSPPITQTNEQSLYHNNARGTTFSTSMNIIVQPHSSQRVVLSITKGEMEIPYRARVCTLLGYEATIEGTFNGTTFYDQNISLDDYKASALMSNLRAGLCKLNTV